MFAASSGFSAGGIALNLVANAIWAILIIGGRKVLHDLDTEDPRRRRRVLVSIATAVAVVLAVALWLLRESSIGRTWGWPLVITAATWVVVFAMWELYRFWRVGLLGADQSVARGIGYDAALRLVKTQLSFLGTGAHKLSRSIEFEKALRRCRSDEPIRLLLRRPDDPTLAAAARRAGKPETEYRDNVIESLRAVARLQASIANIEVRFYGGDLIFRMMVIDSRIALVSFNIYGHGDGSQLPQLHFVDASEGRDVSSSFFHAFERYFNERWDESDPWDFVAHI